MTTRSLQQSKTPSNNPTPTGKNQPQLRVTSPQDKKSSTISKSSNAQFREPSSSPLESK